MTAESWSTRIALSEVFPINGNAFSDVTGVRQYTSGTFYINNTSSVSVDVTMQADPDGSTFNNAFDVGQTHTIASGSKEVITFDGHHRWVRLKVAATSADAADGVETVLLLEHKG